MEQSSSISPSMQIMFFEKADATLEGKCARSVGKDRFIENG